MSGIDSVDAQYRLHPEDLSPGGIVSRVINVSYQGIEDMVPVLHFEGMTKRLVLDQEQGREMIALTMSPLPQDWIGASIRLTVSGHADNQRIAIEPAGSPVRWSSRTARRLAPRWAARFAP